MRAFWSDMRRDKAKKFARAARTETRTTFLHSLMSEQIRLQNARHDHKLGREQQGQVSRYSFCRTIVICAGLRGFPNKKVWVLDPTKCRAKKVCLGRMIPVSLC